MLDSRYGVLRVKGLPFSPPNILLLIVVKQLSFSFMWPEFSSSRFFPFFMWLSANFSPTLRSKNFFHAQQPLSSCWYKTSLTVDTDSCLPAASNSLQTCFLVVFGWHFTSWPVFSQQQVIVCVFLLLSHTTYHNPLNWQFKLLYV